MTTAKSILLVSAALLSLTGCSSAEQNAAKEREDLKRDLLDVKSETSVLKDELRSLKNMAPAAKKKDEIQEQPATATTNSSTSSTSTSSTSTTTSTKAD